MTESILRRLFGVIGEDDTRSGSSGDVLREFLADYVAYEKEGIGRVTIPCRQMYGDEKGTIAHLEITLSKALVLQTDKVFPTLDQIGPNNIFEINERAEEIENECGIKLHYDTSEGIISFENDNGQIFLHKNRVPNSWLMTRDTDCDEYLIVKGLIVSGLDPEIIGKGILVTDFERPEHTSLALPGNIAARYFPSEIDSRYKRNNDLYIVSLDTIKEEQLQMIEELIAKEQIQPVAVCFRETAFSDTEVKIESDLKPAVQCGACGQNYPPSYEFLFEDGGLVAASGSCECPFCGYAQPEE